MNAFVGQIISTIYYLFIVGAFPIVDKPGV